jgi:hypothetical protein
MSLYLDDEKENLMWIIDTAKKYPPDDVDETHQLKSLRPLLNGTRRD